MARHDLRYPDELDYRAREIQGRYGLPSLNATLQMIVTKGCEALETWSLPVVQEVTGDADRDH